MRRRLRLAPLFASLFAMMGASCKGCASDGGSLTVQGADAALDAPRDVRRDAESNEAIADAGSRDALIRVDVVGDDGGGIVGDGGSSSCRLVYGPAEQPFAGPAALATTPTELRVVANDMGRPKLYAVPLVAPLAKGAAVAPSKAPESTTMTRWPPCEIAGRFVYCAGPTGIVTRTPFGGESKQVAKARPGTRIAAAELGPDHSVVAYLDVHRTSEGDMLQAFGVLDEGAPARISEDGAGATTLRLASRGDHAVMAYLDARSAMVPLHARVLGLRDGALVPGSDTVLYVGGAPERGVDLALGRAGEGLVALVPLPRDAADFGMAAIAVADPPKVDVGAVWSPYPNGLDPAPIAATTTASVGNGNAGNKDTAWVARVRPRERKPGTPKILELGRVDASGVFASRGVIVDGPRITDVAIATDAFGAIWVAYGDANETWLERRVCD